MMEPVSLIARAAKAGASSDLAPGRLRLPDESEIFIWRLHLSRTPIEAMLPFVPETERATGERRMSGPVVEARLKAHGALRCILGAYTDQEPRGIAIAAGGDGKPELARNPCGLHFSASRSGDYGLIALGRAPLGVDIEVINPEFAWRGIAEHWFHPRERARLAATAPAQPAETFFQIWTLKEAYLKGVGVGLDHDAMRSTWIAPEGRLMRGLDGALAHDWRLKVLDAPPGYKAALASASAAPNVVDCSEAFALISRLAS